jgi:FKBP-type peptidyl-prolyl cis-trans isomerase SlyD
MVIAPNTVVSITYTLREENAGGAVIQEVNQQDPFFFLFGVGQLLPDFEANIVGKTKGDKVAFSIDSANAYGEFDEEQVIALPKSSFVIEGEIAEEFLRIGALIPLQTQDGQQLTGTVSAIGEEEVSVDLNHPLAGKDLHFSVEVLTVRAATQEEVAHGHVHGDGGHHH